MNSIGPPQASVEVHRVFPYLVLGPAGPRDPGTEPPVEPDESPGPIDPDSRDDNDPVESPEPPRQPGKLSQGL